MNKIFGIIKVKSLICSILLIGILIHQSEQQFSFSANWGKRSLPLAGKQHQQQQQQQHLDDNSRYNSYKSEPHLSCRDILALDKFFTERNIPLQVSLFFKIINNNINIKFNLFDWENLSTIQKRETLLFCVIV